MTRPIASYPEREQASVIRRRALEQRGGLGYLAAIDAQRRLAQIAHGAKVRSKPDERAAA